MITLDAGNVNSIINLEEAGFGDQPAQEVTVYENVL
jgi:hypothetical protein